MMGEIMRAFGELGRAGSRRRGLGRAVPRSADPSCGPERSQHLPRMIAQLPKDKEWLPNLYNASEGLLEGGPPR